jgi:hypothetical protein
MKNKIVSLLKNLVIKQEGGISFSKIWAWITGVLAAIVLLHTQLDAIGVIIPVVMLPIFKFAAIASALITAIRVRNASSPSPILPPSPNPPTAGK